MSGNRWTISNVYRFLMYKVAMKIFDIKLKKKKKKKKYTHTHTYTYTSD